MLRCLFIGLLALFATVPAPRASNADDFLWVGSWNIKLLDTEHVDLFQYGEAHVSDQAPAPLQYQFSGRVAVDPWRHLGFGLGYTYLSRQIAGGVTDEWDDVGMHRLEVEINPRCDLGKGVRLSLRNRLEERWIEDRSGTYPRSRHRLEVTIPLKQAGPVSEVFTFVEPFLDWRREKITQTRVVPLGLTFRLSQQVSLRTYYAWQTLQSAAGDHYNEQMLWTQWLINLR